MTGNPKISYRPRSIIEEIAAERARQKETEGWTADHDDAHTSGELALAAASYALESVHANSFRYVDDNPELGSPVVPRTWPWSLLWWKPKSARRDLVRAAALIVAEIERLDRKKARG